jgi:CRISPR-associated endonuclease/helicase Cas3
MNNPRFWAKTGQAEFENGQPKYHPVICHLADTAAVAMEILRSHLSPLALERLADGLGLTGESLIRFCGFMAGSHDLGKVSPAFQFQVSNVGKILAGETLYDCWSSLPRERQKPRNAPHGLVTAATLPDFLVSIGIGRDLSKRHAKRLAQRLGVIVGGHHGFFPAQKEIDDLDCAIAGTDERSVWRQHSLGIFQQLQGFVNLTASDLPNQCDNAAAMILAGLTTVSDWIASNPDSFPYADDQPFETYSQDLQKAAQNALKAQGWIVPTTGQPLVFTELFDFIADPRPLQSAAIQMTDTLTPPCLVMVEASMGEGKTEVALYLADHLQHQSAAGGFYIGLPTQATSNAMFNRVQKFLQKRYADEVVNLTLSHAAATLMGDYQETVCRLDEVYDEEGRGVFASEWHTARKRTLLSPYGVGTLDQGLMGVVRSRHQFVRLFGLAGRTIILDEIHAYDLYTSTLLERFLEWAAMLGSPVVALSATLPATTRQRLLSAYAVGCGQSIPVLPEAAYPRITAFAEGTALAQCFTASDHVCRQLKIRWVSDNEWPTTLQQALRDNGGCAAVICSTVNRAQAMYKLLQDYFDPKELGLFHGRFLFKDRERIEADCLRKFGKGNDHRPHRFVLVATQVIEQSLDVDFDLMISDLAPIDLLLQRSGRLHRHIDQEMVPRDIKG